MDGVLIEPDNITRERCVGVERSGTPIETTNVRRRREVTAGCCVAQQRWCVADLATSQPYLYGVLGGKSDTMDA